MTDHVARLERVIRERVAKFLCPVHGSALCPEEYMLWRTSDNAGEAKALAPYVGEYNGPCGQRPTAETLIDEARRD